MATERQIEANRKNAKKSTGPKTVGGRGRARANSLRHGLTAKALTIPGESPSELAKLNEKYIGLFGPQGPVEELLVGELVLAEWHMRRAHKTEAESFPQKFGPTFEEGWDPRRAPIRVPQADVLQFEAMLRYGAQAERSYYRALTMLQLMQQRRV